MASSHSSSHPKVAAIISRPNRPEVGQIVPGLLNWLQEHGYQVIVDPTTAQYASGSEVVPRAQLSSRPLDLVVVLGGGCPPLSASRGTATGGRPRPASHPGFAGVLT